MPSWLEIPTSYPPPFSLLSLQSLSMNSRCLCVCRPPTLQHCICLIHSTVCILTSLCSLVSSSIGVFSRTVQVWLKRQRSRGTSTSSWHPTPFLTLRATRRLRETIPSSMTPKSTLPTSYTDSCPTCTARLTLVSFLLTSSRCCV